MITADRLADSGIALSASCLAIGVTIGEINQYLQAAAYIVAMISGISASYYYITRAKRKTQQKSRRKSRK